MDLMTLPTNCSEVLTNYDLSRKNDIEAAAPVEHVDQDVKQEEEYNYRNQFWNIHQKLMACRSCKGKVIVINLNLGLQILITLFYFLRVWTNDNKIGLKACGKKSRRFSLL